MTEIIYPDLSYRIVGLLFEAQNGLGAGLREQDYQKAVSQVLKKTKVPFEEQKYIVLKIKNLNIKRLYVDFVIDNKIALEIKAQERFLKTNIEQILTYLKAGNLKLGITNNK